MSAPTSQTSPPEPPDVEDPGWDDGGWWSRTPGWARAVVAGGLVVLLLLVGAVGGILVERTAAPDYGPGNGSIDTAFLQDMGVHHQQAVQMAVWERANTTDPALRQLAFDIESSQTAQIGRMEGWLTLWEQPLSPPDGQFMGWMGMPMPAMPGMATPEELARFKTTTGPAMDTMFLQLMLRHHRGGIPMARAAAERASVPAVQQLAASIVRAQSAEVATMTRMLAERGAAPLPDGPSMAGMGGMPGMPGMPTGGG